MRAGMKRFAAVRLAAAAVAVALAAACGDVLEVRNPGPIPDEDLNRTDAVQSVVNGMSLDLSRAIDVLIQGTPIMADELYHGGSYAAEGLWNRGIIKPEDVNGLWGSTHRARWVAESGIERLRSTLGADFDRSPFVARAFIYAGLANRTLGELFCDAVIDGGARQAHTVHFSRAEAHFTEAIRIANGLTGAVKDSLLRVAYGGRASVRAWQNKWADAAADAALVPTGYVFVSFFSLNRTIENNNLATETQLTGGRREYTVFNTQWASVTDDPRVPWVTTTALGQDGRTRFYRQMKYPDRDSDVPLVKGTEMLILRAEERLRAGDVAQAMQRINDVRTFHRLPALTATTAAQAWPILQRERAATTWLEARRLWDLRRWNAEPAPVKNTYLDTRDKCIPISENERLANINLRG
jgi:starch-binding outer membrane protein, SusD/RagB family